MNAPNSEEYTQHGRGETATKSVPPKERKTPQIAAVKTTRGEKRDVICARVVQFVSEAREEGESADMEKSGSREEGGGRETAFS